MKWYLNLKSFLMSDKTGLPSAMDKLLRSLQLKPERTPDDIDFHSEKLLDWITFVVAIVLPSTIVILWLIALI